MPHPGKPKVLYESLYPEGGHTFLLWVGPITLTLQGIERKPTEAEIEALVKLIQQYENPCLQSQPSRNLPAR